MRKNGFTLIELLAVITVLGLILVIAILKFNQMIQVSRENAFFSTAKAIIRNIEYDKIEELSLDSTKLSSLHLSEISTEDYDLDNSYAYIAGGKTYLNLVGAGKFEGYNMCQVTSDTKDYTLETTVCPINSGTAISVNLNGGTMKDTLYPTYLEGDKVNLGIPTKYGYTFDGWQVLSGDSYVLKNLIENSNFKNGMDGWPNIYNSSISISDDVASIVATVQYGGLIRAINKESVLGHIVYSSAQLMTDSLQSYWVYGNDGLSQGVAKVSNLGTWERVSGVRTISVSANTLYCKTQDGRASGWTTTYMKHPILIDLTATFGEGNEPCSSSNKTWCDNNIDYFDGYQLIIGNTETIIKAKWIQN